MNDLSERENDLIMATATLTTKTATDAQVARDFCVFVLRGLPQQPWYRAMTRAQRRTLCQCINEATRAVIARAGA